MTDTSADPRARRLIVVRHSKTEQFATSDHRRRLTERGERDAARIGQWLASHAISPDLVLVSSAARALRTAELMVEALAGEPETSVLDALYAAGGADALEIVQGIPDDVTCAAVVGHNPTMAALAMGLVDDDDAIHHFPTSATAVLSFTGPWSALDEDLASLERFHTPHDS